MENKYYTPSLEEFHVGFEFEFKHPDYPEQDWMKYSTPELNVEHEDCPFTYKNLKDFRVKYLDREDIESLGFKHVVDKGFDHSYDEYWVSGQWYIKNIWINKAEGLEIGSAMYEKQFQGNIKNKSELRKILKMCGYETTGTE